MARYHRGVCAHVRYDSYMHDVLTASGGVVLVLHVQRFDCSVGNEQQARVRQALGVAVGMDPPPRDDVRPRIGHAELTPRHNNNRVPGRFSFLHETSFDISAPVPTLISHSFSVTSWMWGRGRDFVWRGHQHQRGRVFKNVQLSHATMMIVFCLCVLRAPSPVSYWAVWTTRKRVLAHQFHQNSI